MGAPGRHPSLLILDSAGGNEPRMHKLVKGIIVIRVPFAISSLHSRLCRLNKMSLLHQELSEMRKLIKIKPYLVFGQLLTKGKDFMKNRNCSFNCEMARAILKLLWESKIIYIDMIITRGKQSKERI